MVVLESPIRRLFQTNGTVPNAEVIWNEYHAILLLLFVHYDTRARTYPSLEIEREPSQFGSLMLARSLSHVLSYMELLMTASGPEHSRNSGIQGSDV